MGSVTEVLVPGGEGRAFRVPKDALLEVVDVEGQQVADFISIIESDPKEWLSATHTRSTLLQPEPEGGRPSPDQLAARKCTRSSATTLVCTT